MKICWLHEQQGPVSTDTGQTLWLPKPTVTMDTNNRQTFTDKLRYSSVCSPQPDVLFPSCSQVEMTNMLLNLEMDPGETDGVMVEGRAHLHFDLSHLSDENHSIVHLQMLFCQLQNNCATILDVTVTKRAAALRRFIVNAQSTHLIQHCMFMCAQFPYFKYFKKRLLTMP